jgi:ubiquinone/menaquinone biosynthesis C-methylase UbiE
MKKSRLADKLILKPIERAIVDIGCGNLPIFLMTTKFSEKYALDKFDLDSDKEIQEYDINFLNYDIEAGESLPFPSEYFNVVTMLAVFEHIEPGCLHRTLEEIYRVLKSGGMFIMTTPAFWSDGLLKLLAKLHLVSAVEIEEHKDTYTPKKIHHMLTATSFAGDKIKNGYFEFFLNIWVTAEK